MTVFRIALMASALVASGCVPDDVAQGDTPSVKLTDGLYNQDPAQCANPNSETRLTISGDTFRFYESECTFGREGGQSGASEGTLICMGEGQRFTRDIRLETVGEQLSIHENGARLTYSRCPA